MSADPVEDLRRRAGLSRVGLVMRGDGTYSRRLSGIEADYIELLEEYIRALTRELVMADIRERSRVR